MSNRIHTIAGVLLAALSLAACRPAEPPSEDCRRQSGWRRVGRSANPDPRLDALEEMRCDGMQREERREEREDAHRAEDKRERDRARRMSLRSSVEPTSPDPGYAIAPGELPDLSRAVAGRIWA